MKFQLNLNQIINCYQTSSENFNENDFVKNWNLYTYNQMGWNGGDIEGLVHIDLPHVIVCV